MVGSKTTCPKWQFGQVENGDIWGNFWSIFPFKKPCFLILQLCKIHLQLQPTFNGVLGNSNVLLG
jgi:hypothetical protein